MDDCELNPGIGGRIIRADDIAGKLFQAIKITIGDENIDDGFVHATNPLPVAVSGMVTGLVTEAHDWIGITYNGLGKIGTVTYKLGGSGGATVATLTLAYSSGRLSSVAKS